MCGIATIAIGRHSRGRIPYDRLRALTRELLIELQPRGYDASGIAVINEPGTEESWVFKKPLRPESLVRRPKFEQTLQKISPHTNFIMLHSRWTTIGAATANFNNHPIIIPNFIGIHNGTLDNDDKLFEEHKDDFERGGEVDSEAIFRLFGHHTDLGLDPQMAMQHTAAQLEGAFTGAVLDWRHPRRMVMFKFERPLSLIRIPYYDMVVTVSESKFWERASRRLKIKVQDKISYVEDKTGLLFDLNAEGKLVDTLVDFKLPVQDNGRLGRRHNGWFSHYYAG